jgi:hypothetical protein
MTESASCSRPIQAVSAMADASYFRDRAEQCLRLARDSTDPVLIKSLTDLAAEYSAQATAIEASAFGKDEEDQ